MTIKLTINFKPVEAQPGQTVLQAAQANGIIIPTLCHHRDLSPVGSCRLCLVEVEGMRGQPAACTLPVSAGMVVRTETPALAEARRLILELLLRSYHDASYLPAGRPDTEFMRWVRTYGAQPPADDGARVRWQPGSDPNPFIWVDWNKCILCTRCVRACAEIQGRWVWGVGGRGAEAHIIAGANTALLDARCESCGACAAYCPTGALDDKLALAYGQPDKKVTTTCTYCGVGCQLDLNVKQGRVVRVTSAPDAPVNGMALCVKGRYGYDFIHHPDRVLRPRVRRYLLEGAGRRQQDAGRGEWVEVDWDTALDLTARRLGQTRDEHGPDSVGVLTSAKCLNEENYLMNKFARQVIGTNNIDHCARL